MQNIQHLDAFNIIGISIETTNVNGQTAQDLGQLWGQFYSQNIISVEYYKKYMVKITNITNILKDIPYNISWILCNNKYLPYV